MRLNTNPSNGMERKERERRYSTHKGVHIRVYRACSQHQQLGAHCHFDKHDHHNRIATAEARSDDGEQKFGLCRDNAPPAIDSLVPVSNWE